MVTTESANGRDRRGFERYPAESEARVEPLDDRQVLGRAFPVTIRDAGRTGVRFRVDRVMEPGTQWRLWLTHQGQLFTSVPIVVRYCHEQPSDEEDGDFQAGAQFMLEPFFLARLLGREEGALSFGEVREEDRFAESR